MLFVQFTLIILEQHINANIKWLYSVVCTSWNVTSKLLCIHEATASHQMLVGLSLRLHTEFYLQIQKLTDCRKYYSNPVQPASS